MDWNSYPSIQYFTNVHLSCLVIPCLEKVATFVPETPWEKMEKGRSLSLSLSLLLLVDVKAKENEAPKKERGKKEATHGARTDPEP